MNTDARLVSVLQKSSACRRNELWRWNEPDLRTTPARTSDNERASWVPHTTANQRHMHTTRCALKPWPWLPRLNHHLSCRCEKLSPCHPFFNPAPALSAACPPLTPAPRHHPPSTPPVRLHSPIFGSPLCRSALLLIYQPTSPLYLISSLPQTPPPHISSLLSPLCRPTASLFLIYHPVSESGPNGHPTR